MLIFTLININVECKIKLIVHIQRDNLKLNCLTEPELNLDESLAATPHFRVRILR